MKNILWFGAALAAMIYFFELGHWAMLGGLILLIVLHEFGHWFVARLFGFEVPIFSVGFGSSPRIVFGKFWGTEFQLTPWLIGGYVKIDPTAESFQSKAIWKRASVMAAGVVMNVLLSVVLIWTLFGAVGQREVQFTSVNVQEVSQTITVARDAGLQAGDQILSVEGVKVSSPAEFAAQVQGGTPPLTVEVKRGSEVLSFEVTPQNGKIGIVMGGTQEVVYHKMGFFEAAYASVKFNVDITKQMFAGLGMMVGLVEVPSSVPDGAADVHGLVAIVQIGASAFDAGLYSFVFMLALISMNLAIMNILPVPVLDGGHLLFLAVEKVRGKPLSKEVQGTLGMIFMFLLFGLMFLGLYNDIFKPIGR